MKMCSPVKTCPAFTFAELMVVVVIISLFVLLALPNVVGLVEKTMFKSRQQEFVSTIQMAASAAAESDRRYELIVDIPQQSYTLRQITSDNLAEISRQDIIVQNDFDNKCVVSYVLFDDGKYTNEDIAKFRVGRSGWAYGGKIVLLDKKQNPYTVIINRLNRIVKLKEGDVEILLPRSKDELPF